MFMRHVFQLTAHMKRCTACHFDSLQCSTLWKALIVSHYIFSFISFSFFFSFYLLHFAPRFSSGRTFLFKVIFIFLISLCLFCRVSPGDEVSRRSQLSRKVQLSVLQVRQGLHREDESVPSFEHCMRHTVYAPLQHLRIQD